MKAGETVNYLKRLQVRGLVPFLQHYQQNHEAISICDSLVSGG